MNLKVQLELESVLRQVKVGNGVRSRALELSVVQGANGGGTVKARISCVLDTGIDIVVQESSARNVQGNLDWAGEDTRTVT